MYRTVALKSTNSWIARDITSPDSRKSLSEAPGQLQDKFHLEVGHRVPHSLLGGVKVVFEDLSVVQLPLAGVHGHIQHEIIEARVHAERNRGKMGSASENMSM
mmetsp:Transcript_4122/g.12605  ORF Transcript_4122/g.12605 Transcript_4122/m.12605 type:complete len:103 (-) Transcript_4122:205-513(-)